MEILYGVPDMDDFIDDTIKRCLLDYDLGRQDTETVLEDMERERTLEKSGKEDNQDVGSDIDSHDNNNNKSKNDIGSSKSKSRINSNRSDIDEVQSRKSPQTPADPTSNYGVLFRTIEKSKVESDDRCSSSQREHCNYMVTSPSSVPDLSRGQSYFHSDQDSDDGELMRKETRCSPDRVQSPKMGSTMKLKSRLQERYFRSSRDATPDLPSDSDHNRKSVSPSGSSSSSDSKYMTSSNDHSLNVSDNSSNSSDDRCLHSLKRNVHGELLVNGNSTGQHASRKADPTIPTSNRRSSDPSSDTTWTKDPLDKVARMGRQHSQPSSAVSGIPSFDDITSKRTDCQVYPTQSSNKVNFHIEVLNRLKQRRIVPQKDHSGKCREKKQLKPYRNLKQKKNISSDLTPVQYLVAKKRDNTNNISQQDCQFNQFKNNQESPLKSQRDQQFQGFYHSHLHQRQTNNYTTSNNEAEVQRRYAQLRQFKRDAENLRFNGSDVRPGDRTRSSQPNPLTRIANFNENSSGENILSERLAAPPQSAHSHQASIPNDLSRREYQHHHQYHYPSVISRPDVHSVSPPTTSSPNVAAPVPSQPPPLLRVTFSPHHQALNGLTNHHQQQQQQHQHHHYQQQHQQQHHLVAGPTTLSMLIGREDRVHQHQQQHQHHNHSHQDMNSVDYRFPRVYGSDHYPVSSASPIHDDYDVPQDLTMKSSVR